MTGIIEGDVWADQNGDGQWQPAEPGLPGIVVRLSQAATGASLGETDRDVLTDEAGRYRLTDVVPGSYLVEIMPPARYRTTTERRFSIKVAANTLTTVLPVGLRRLTIIFLPVMMKH